MSVGTNNIDGYIGQVWTGPINWALNSYNASDESFFGSAYALYDFFTQLTIGTDRELWLLVDPVEDEADELGEEDVKQAGPGHGQIPRLQLEMQ